MSTRESRRHYVDGRLERLVQVLDTSCIQSLGVDTRDWYSPSLDANTRTLVSGPSLGDTQVRPKSRHESGIRRP